MAFAVKLSVPTKVAEMASSVCERSDAPSRPLTPSTPPRAAPRLVKGFRAPKTGQRSLRALVLEEERNRLEKKRRTMELLKPEADAKAPLAARSRSPKMASGRKETTNDCNGQVILRSTILRRKLPHPELVNFTTSKAQHLRPRLATLRDNRPDAAMREPKAPSKLEARDLRAPRLLTQVQEKFIVMRSEGDLGGEHPGGVLLIIDQHAASERVELERLQQQIRSTKVPKEAVHGPETVVSLVADERRWLAKHQEFVEGWGFGWRSGVLEHEVVVTHVPNILGTCLSPKDLKGVLSSVEATHVGGKHSVPPVMLHILAFKACRRAIKFGDPLSEVQMDKLLRELSKCDFPFQCAHGRPTVYPVASLQQLEFRSQVKRIPVAGLLSQMCAGR
ncbi:unnamed protein product [Durusdinium trenchii]|uniref:MutL C-terminal dimerisation domain-containing protein n=1 Tax=Durusdinium trenchii TaxID=1381693 RepID=A0ABP0SDQ3_9DINO